MNNTGTRLVIGIAAVGAMFLGGPPGAYARAPSPAPRRTLFSALRRPFVVLWLTGLLLGAVTPGSALQDDRPQASQASQASQAPSRAELLKAERVAQPTSEPQRTTGEKGLDGFASASRFISAYQGGWKGFHFDGGEFPTGAGFAYGIGFTELAVRAVTPDPDLPNRIDVTATAAYSTNSYLQVSGDVSFLNLGGSWINFALRAKYFEWPSEDFYGLGPDSEEDNRTSFFQGGSEYGTDVWLQPLHWLRVGGGAFYLSPDIRRGEDSRFPDFEEIFPPGTVPGFTLQQNFIRLDTFASLDFRDEPLFPRSGGYVGVRAKNFKDQDLGRFDFRQYEVDAQYYLPWMNKYRVLALRANVVISETNGDKRIPFYYMPTLGGGEKLRGFREFRFRDRNAMVLTAEYRWEAWWPLEMALFVDAGKVTARRQDLDFEDLEVGYGIGFRFHSHDAVSFRLDLARSKEGFFPLFRYIHVF